MFWRRTSSERPRMDPERARRAIVQVGLNGRGFISGRNVITAASCLPHFPPFNLFSREKFHVYEHILGPLGQDPWVTAACYFADPMSNVAVLSGDWDGDYEHLINWKWAFEKSMQHYNA